MIRGHPRSRVELCGVEPSLGSLPPRLHPVDASKPATIKCVGIPPNSKTIFASRLYLDAVVGLLYLLLVLISVTPFILQLEQHLLQTLLQLSVVLGLGHTFPGTNEKKS